MCLKGRGIPRSFQLVRVTDEGFGGRTGFDFGQLDFAAGAAIAVKEDLHTIFEQRTGLPFGQIGTPLFAQQGHGQVPAESRCDEIILNGGTDLVYPTQEGFPGFIGPGHNQIVPIGIKFGTLRVHDHPKVIPRRSGGNSRTGIRVQRIHEARGGFLEGLLFEQFTNLLKVGILATRTDHGPGAGNDAQTLCVL